MTAITWTLAPAGLPGLRGAVMRPFAGTAVVRPAAVASRPAAHGTGAFAAGLRDDNDGTTNGFQPSSRSVS